MKSFSSFGGFAQHLAALAGVGTMNAIGKHVLEEAAVVIEARAKQKIGEYQGQAGPFDAWQELAESTKEDRQRQGYTENDPGLRTGAMRDSVEHTATSEVAHVGSNDDHMVYFELGTTKQPPRSVLGGAAFEKAAEVVELVGSGMALHLEGKALPRRKAIT